VKVGDFRIKSYFYFIKFLFPSYFLCLVNFLFVMFPIDMKTKDTR
jgi:hypothetical protein